MALIIVHNVNKLKKNCNHHPSKELGYIINLKKKNCQISFLNLKYEIKSNIEDFI